MVGLAVIGVGRWGQNIIRTIEGLPTARLVAVCGASEAELAPFKGRVATTTDSTTLLPRDDIDGVLIATPGSTHAAVALPFIEKGIPTFIEKPLTTSLADAEKLKRASQKSSARVFVGHIHLYNPAYQTARALLSTLGRLRFIYSEGTNNGPFHNDMSALWDWGPHDVYTALDIVGKLPQSVQAWGIATLRPHTRLHDFTILKLVFADDVEAVTVTSWLLPQKQKKTTIVGTTSSLVFDEAQEKKVILYQQMGPRVADDTVTPQTPIISYPAYESTLPLTNEIMAFIAAITSGEQPISTIEQGVAVVKILAAAEKSIAIDGAPVAV